MSNCDYLVNSQILPWYEVLDDPSINTCNGIPTKLILMLVFEIVVEIVVKDT